jgi:hypothetical protein
MKSKDILKSKKDEIDISLSRDSKDIKLPTVEDCEKL